MKQVSTEWEFAKKFSEKAKNNELKGVDKRDIKKLLQSNILPTLQDFDKGLKHIKHMASYSSICKCFASLFLLYYP